MGAERFLDRHRSKILLASLAALGGSVALAILTAPQPWWWKVLAFPFVVLGARWAAPVLGFVLVVAFLRAEGETRREALRREWRETREVVPIMRRHRRERREEARAFWSIAERLGAPGRLRRRLVAEWSGLRRMLSSGSGR